MKISNFVGPALLGTCLYGAVMNSFPTNEEKDAVGEVDATNEVERAACAEVLGLKTTLGMTQGEIVAAIRGVGELGRVDVENVENGREDLESAAGETRGLRLRRPDGLGSGGTVLGRSQWGVRGAWDDDCYQAFETDWVFPFGTNHLSGVVVYSQGGLAASSYDEPFVSLPIPVAIVPREGSFTVEQTSSNSYIFAWWNVRPGRTATETLDAQIEFFRNGDYCVSTNGVIVESFIRGNPYPDAPIGQDPVWVRSNFENADDILAVGYTNWVRWSVCENAPNGLFCLEVTFDHDPEEIVWLSVGDKVVVVNAAGIYPFVLPKGERHEIAMSFVPEGTEFTYYDAFTNDSTPASCQTVSRMVSNQNVHTEITASGSSEAVEVVVPHPYAPLGYITWTPYLSISPDRLLDPSFPVLFYAFVDLPYGEHPSVRWTSDDGSVSETGEWLTYDGSESVRGITVVASYKGVELTGYISMRQIVSETRIDLAAPSVIVVEDPYTNRPNEVVVRTSDTVKMTASWALAQSGRLSLVSEGAMPTRVCVGSGMNEITSFPYDIGSFGQYENGSVDFYLTSTNMSVTGRVGSYQLRFIPDEGAECVSSADIQIVKIRVEADADWPSNKVRHVFGPKELVHVRVVNASSSIRLLGSLPDHGLVISNSNDFIVPDQPGPFAVNGTVDGTSFSIDCTCVGPTHLRGDSPRSLTSNEWLELQVPPFANGEAGVLVHIDTYLEPSFVSFEQLRLFEGLAPPCGRQGWYLDTNKFPDSDIGHTVEAGASSDPATEYFTIGSMNKTSIGDYIGSWIGSANTYSNGSYRVDIPVSWYTVGCSVTNRISDNVQTMWVYDNGSMRVNKNGVSWQRDLNGLEYQP